MCDTNAGAASSPGLPLPQNRFRHPEDAREQLVRALDLHQKVFGVRPQGVWPSEGSVSEETLAIAHSLGIQWMATDEGVLGRSTGVFFQRDGNGRLPAHLAERLYNIHRYENGATAMHLVFRDHTISDLIGFVYSGMDPQDAAGHLIAQHQRGGATGAGAGARRCGVSDSRWRKCLGILSEVGARISAALLRCPAARRWIGSSHDLRGDCPPSQRLALAKSLVPGSWINANFNVWIGAPEDNRAWDYLHHAREFYAQHAGTASDGATKTRI